MPISLCNCIYKVIERIIANRLKLILSKNVYKEQFAFLECRQIHEAIRVSQKSIRSLKSKEIKGLVIKIGLYKVYDRVRLIYIRFLLTHEGFEVPFIK